MRQDMNKLKRREGGLEPPLFFGGAWAMVTRRFMRSRQVAQISA